MNAEKYTQKSLEAVREAQELVIRNQNMQIDQQHLLYALLTQEGGLIAQLLKKLQLGKTHIAIIVDEYGGTSGLPLPGGASGRGELG